MNHPFGEKGGLNNPLISGPSQSLAALPLFVWQNVAEALCHSYGGLQCTIALTTGRRVAAAPVQTDPLCRSHETAGH